MTKSITVKCERRIKVCNWDAVAIDFSEQCSHLKQPLPPRGAAFYRDRLGHELIWRDDSAAGLRLPDSDAELVLHTDDRLMETDFLVVSVPAAISRFVEAGGKLIAGP